MKHLLNISTIILALTIIFSSAQVKAQVPAKLQQQRIVIKGATAHIGNGLVVENSIIAFEKGKIVYAGAADGYTSVSGEKVVDATGKHVYPSFIAPNTILGLVEINAVRATRDFHEVGVINPSVRSLISYNAESKITTTIRTNGVLVAQVVPRGGLISGSSSIFNLDGWNWEDAVKKEDDGIWMNWPGLFHQRGWWAEPGPTEKDTKGYEEDMQKLDAFFSKAQAYATGKFDKTDLRLDAVTGLFDGSKTLYINANFAKEITDAVLFAKKHEVKKVVIVGGQDSWRVAEILRENNVSVIVERLHSLPGRTDDDVDLPYKLPKLLKDAGVLFCLNYAGDMEAMGTRNLPFTAGTAVAYGLKKEEALKSITLDAARILGIDQTLGSLEVGKDATLFISTGDALDMRTNNVEIAFIEGKELDLTNHQKELFEKYSSKYGF